MSFELNLTRDQVGSAPLQDPLRVEPSASLGEVLRSLGEHRRGSVLVCRDGVLAGILTERDLVRLLADGLDPSRRVDEVMTTDPVTVRPETTMAEAICRMAEGGFRRLPVVDADGRPQGMLKVTGVIQYLTDHVPEAVYNLPPRPNPVSATREGP